MQCDMLSVDESIRRQASGLIGSHQEDALQYLLEGSAGDHGKRVPFRADLNLTSTITYSGYLSQDQFPALRLSFLI